MRMQTKLRNLQHKLDESETELEVALDECEQFKRLVLEMETMHWTKLVELKNEIQSLRHDGGGYRQVVNPYDD